VLPKHLLEGVSPAELVDAEFNLKPVGTGPYQFDHLMAEQGQVKGVVFSAFEDYYRDRPFIDQIVFLYFSDPQAALAAYQQGEVQGISSVSEDILPQVLNNPELNLYTGRMPELSLIYLNLDSAEAPFFQDATLRRALLMGINRQQMVDKVLGGQAIIADGPVFPGSWAYLDDIEHIGYDPTVALETIKKAGYTIPAEGGSVRVEGWRNFPLRWSVDDELPRPRQIIQENWVVQDELERAVNTKSWSIIPGTRSYQAAW
jgi:peptide/nickel transport system substrate-binding protein